MASSGAPGTDAADGASTWATLDDAGLQVLFNSTFDRGLNPVMRLLGGRLVEVDVAAQTVTASFETVEQFSNGTSVQGGISAAMLDATCAYLVLCATRLAHGMTSLEQKCVYLAPVPVGVAVHATARFVRKGSRIAFCEASLFRPGEAAEPLVTATQTCMLIPGPAHAQRLQQQQPHKAKRGRAAACEGSTAAPPKL